MAGERVELGPYRTSARPPERPPTWRQRLAAQLRRVIERWAQLSGPPTMHVTELVSWPQERGRKADELEAQLAVARLPAASWARVRAFEEFHFVTFLQQFIGLSI